MALVLAVMHLYKFFVIFYCFSGIGKWVEWSTIPASPGPMCFFFFIRGNTEGTNSSKILSLIFLYFLCRFVSGLILWFFYNLWFDDLHAE